MLLVALVVVEQVLAVALALVAVVFVLAMLVLPVVVRVQVVVVLALAVVLLLLAVREQAVVRVHVVCLFEMFVLAACVLVHAATS